MANFKDEVDVVSKLIKYSEPSQNIKTIFIWPEGVFINKNFYKNEKIKELFKKNFIGEFQIVTYIEINSWNKSFNIQELFSNFDVYYQMSHIHISEHTRQY